MGQTAVAFNCGSLYFGLLGVLNAQKLQGHYLLTETVQREIQKQYSANPLKQEKETKEPSNKLNAIFTSRHSKK